MKRVVAVVGGLLVVLVMGATAVSADTPTPTDTPTGTVTTGATATPTATASSGTSATATSTVAGGTTTTPTATRTATPTATATRTATATHVPAARIEWPSDSLAVTLTPGATSDQTLTFRVSQAVDQVTVASTSAGGTLALSELPTSLEPDTDYHLTVSMTLGEDPKQWPLRGTVIIRAKGHTIGPVLLVRGVAPRQATPAPGETRTPSPVSTRSATPRAGATAVPAANRVTWEPSMIRRSMMAGDTAQVQASFTVTQRIAEPMFKVFTRDGAVSIEPSSLPGTLEPGQTYTITLNLAAPSKHASSATGTVLIRDGKRSLGSALIIRLTVIKPTATPTVG